MIRIVAERAGWTALQAFLGVFMMTDLSSAKAAVIAGVAAGLAVVKNAVQEKLAA